MLRRCGAVSQETSRSEFIYEIDVRLSFYEIRLAIYLFDETWASAFTSRFTAVCSGRNLR